MTETTKTFLRSWGRRYGACLVDGVYALAVLRSLDGNRLGADFGEGSVSGPWSNVVPQHDADTLELAGGRPAPGAGGASGKLDGGTHGVGTPNNPGRRFA